MSRKRDKSKWVLEPEYRQTINQKIGGLLYDFIDNKNIRLSNNTYKQLLSCVREETRMSDRSLQRVFLGKNENVIELYRIIFAIQEITGSQGFRDLWNAIGQCVHDFGKDKGIDFLEEQLALHRHNKVNRKIYKHFENPP